MLSRATFSFRLVFLLYFVTVLSACGDRSEPGIENEFEVQDPEIEKDGDAGATVSDTEVEADENSEETVHCLTVGNDTTLSFGSSALGETTRRVVVA